MSQDNKTIKARIQLKSDTEANWKKSVLRTDHVDGEKTSGTSFVPLLGELIVFENDTTHPFSRLKIGDGRNNVLALPFIDAGSINGDAAERIQVYSNKNNFPQQGDQNKLYIDQSQKQLYYYTNQYIALSYTFAVPVSSLITFTSGIATAAVINNGILTIYNGTAPSIGTSNYNILYKP